jgi:hypothetical protein
MAIADVSAAYEDPIRAFLKGLEDVMGRDGGRAHHPDVPHVGRILKAAHSGKIGAGVCAPVAKERQDSWFELHHGKPSLRVTVSRRKFLRNVELQNPNAKRMSNAKAQMIVI